MKAKQTKRMTAILMAGMLLAGCGASATGQTGNGVDAASSQVGGGAKRSI